MYRLVFLICILFVGVAHADPRAEMTCLDGHNISRCKDLQMKVVFETQGSSKLRGGYGIMMLRNGGDLMYWTETAGWQSALPGVLLKPTEPSLQTLSTHKEYVVYRGSDMCKLSQGKSFALAGWFYGLQPHDFQKHRAFISRFEIKDTKAENLWNAVMLSGAIKQKNMKILYQQECKS